MSATSSARSFTMSGNDDEERYYEGDGVLWKRVRLIGRGAHGWVYVARAVVGANLPPRMAVKSSINGSNCYKESTILEEIGDCPFIIKYIGDETTNSLNCTPMLSHDLLLEYASGGSLRDLLKKSRNRQGLPEIEVRRYTRDVFLRGLRHIHSKGFVHCDIKPDNILLVPSDGDSGGNFVAKIGDLGLAKLANRGQDTWRGTVSYLVPETVTYNQQGLPSDIWALGCTVRVMLQLDSDNHNTVSSVAMEFIGACMKTMPDERWASEMLLPHPFVSGLDKPEEKERPRRKRRKLSEFIDACMKFLLDDGSTTAEMLLRHPFVAGLIKEREKPEEEEDEEDEEKQRIRGRKRRKMALEVIDNIIYID